MRYNFLYFFKLKHILLKKVSFFFLNMVRSNFKSLNAILLHNNNNNKYSCKRQSAGSNLFRPKPATLTLITRISMCSSKICATHSHDKPQISPN